MEPCAYLPTRGVLGLYRFGVNDIEMVCSCKASQIQRRLQLEKSPRLRYLLLGVVRYYHSSRVI